ncbi:hypothetical protein SVAN01_07452 [Stagonosporopsis vannaccii]|nr:hypothetical protein SVAN01_07452 [Stagonosporopsis vannaccii]
MINAAVRSLPAARACWRLPVLWRTRSPPGAVTVHLVAC